MSTNITKLQVWWIPQVPCKQFTVEVPTVEAGVMLMGALAAYDAFQFENNIKPDYCNAGGLCEWVVDKGDGEPGWADWYDEETGEDDPAEWLKKARQSP